jgi:hypothetical protein
VGCEVGYVVNAGAPSAFLVGLNVGWRVGCPVGCLVG